LSEVYILLDLLIGFTDTELTTRHNQSLIMQDWSARNWRFTVWMGSNESVRTSRHVL